MVWAPNFGLTRRGGLPKLLSPPPQVGCNRVFGCETMWNLLDMNMSESFWLVLFHLRYTCTPLLLIGLVRATPSGWLTTKFVHQSPFWLTFPYVQQQNPQGILNKISQKKPPLWLTDPHSFSNIGVGLSHRGRPHVQWPSAWLPLGLLTEADLEVLMGVDSLSRI